MSGLQISAFAPTSHPTSEMTCTDGRALAKHHRLPLVDECRLFLGPIVVGGGKRALPDTVRGQLELLDERRFRNGVVHLHYGVSI